MSKTLYAGMMLCIFCAVMHLSAQGGGDAKLERFDVGASYGVHFGVDIVSVDADKGIIVFIRKNGAEQKVQVVKDCVCKVGSYHYGKPASTMEGKEFADGIRNDVFKKASAEMPLRADILTARTDNDGKGIKAGEAVKILVNRKK